MTTPIHCPACLHTETMRARLKGDEPSDDDAALMTWRRDASGMFGQQPTVYTHGAWSCTRCGLSLAPGRAAVLLDAALWARDPRCDSITDEGYYADSLRAAKGGE